MKLRMLAMIAVMFVAGCGGEAGVTGDSDGINMVPAIDPPVPIAAPTDAESTPSDDDEDRGDVTMDPGDIPLVEDPRGQPPEKIEPPADEEQPPDQDSPEDDPPPDQDPPEDDPPVACQGHAVAVKSFTPGAFAGFGNADFPDIVLGPPEGNGSGSGGFDVLSLGLGGEIVLDLGDCRVVNGPGVDLLIFENAFFIDDDPTSPFAELAAVGVSNDGVSFVEFLCSEAGYPYIGCAGWHAVYSSTSNNISPFDIANAGGDRFDLAFIGMTEARFVRIRDLGYGFASGNAAGFDLDAVSVIHGEVVP